MEMSELLQQLGSVPPELMERMMREMPTELRDGMRLLDLERTFLDNAYPLTKKKHPKMRGKFTESFSVTPSWSS